METAEMGRVTVEVQVNNLEDEWDVQNGRKTPDQIRSITVPNALIDSGASTLALPTSLIQQLGLKKVRDRPIRPATGTGTSGLYEVVHMHVQGRDCKVEVMELPEGSPVLIGQIPLELMDWVIDMKNHKLIGNPAHNGDWVRTCP
jgi:predicted aspartyl protease